MPIKIEANASGTGIFTITNPNSAVSRGITLPDASTELVGTDTAQTLTNKTFVAPSLTNANLTTPFLINTPFSSPAQVGELEFNGTAPYFTPTGTSRGVIPSIQHYRLNSVVVGTNAIGPQSLFGVGVTLSAGTTYAFNSTVLLTKTAGVTSHSVSTLFGGTATISNGLYHAFSFPNASTPFTSPSASLATSTVVTGPIAVASAIVSITLNGTVAINAGGTFIPQYSLSVAPGGAYSVNIGSFFSIWPIGPASTVAIGNWS